jgi:hypothetical protein
MFRALARFCPPWDSDLQRALRLKTNCSHQLTAVLRRQEGFLIDIF